MPDTLFRLLNVRSERFLSYAKIVFFDNREYQKLYYCFHFFIFFAFLFYGVCDVAVWTVAGVNIKGKS